MATILCIDDEEPVRRFFQVALEGAGYRVLTAENGRLGLRLLEHQEVDLNFVDIFMPEMDGVELIREIRKIPEYDALPVVMVTTNSESEHLGTAMDAGANEYIQKPCTLDMLRDKLDLLGLIKP